MFKLKDVIFKLFGSDFKARDSYKNKAGKGILQRYNETLAEEFDDYSLNAVNSFVENTVCSQTVIDKFVAYLEYNIGAPYIIDDLYIRRKLMQYLFRIYRIKGTIPSYEAMFRIFGFDVDFYITTTPTLLNKYNLYKSVGGQSVISNGVINIILEDGDKYYVQTDGCTLITLGSGARLKRETVIDIFTDTYTFDSGNNPPPSPLIYLLDDSYKTIKIYDRNSGDLQSEFGIVFDNPQGIYKYLDRIYVADFVFNRVIVFDAETGTHLPGEDFGNPFLAGPRSITIENGVIYVAGAVNVIYAFDLATKVHLSSKDLGFGMFANPQYLSSKDGKVYIADFGANKVLIFDSVTNAHLGDIGVGVLSSPVHSHVFGGRIYVTDYGNNRICVFDLTTGSYLPSESYGVVAPRCIFISRGRAYITSFSSSQLLVYTVSGTAIPIENISEALVSPVDGFALAEELNEEDVNQVNITFDDDGRTFDMSCASCSKYVIRLYGSFALTPALHAAIFRTIEFLEPINADLAAVYYNDYLLVAAESLSVWIDDNGDLNYDNTAVKEITLSLNGDGDLIIDGENPGEYGIDTNGDLIKN